MREYSLEQWRREIEGWTAPKVDPTFSPPTMARPAPTTPAPHPHYNAIPTSFGEAEKAALVSAHRSAGGFIRGLGAGYADDFSASIYEQWNGESILSTPDPAKRARALDVIRQEVGAAVLTKPTAREVAGRIRQRVGDLARDFERIAETELQAVHNEGQIYQAVAIDGDDAMVARIPESTACSSCRALFVNPETSEPYVFSVSKLAENGTNVGRKRADWVATAYPLHPKCRCDIIHVSEGQKVSSTGRLIKKDAL